MERSQILELLKWYEVMGVDNIMYDLDNSKEENIESEVENINDDNKLDFRSMNAKEIASHSKSLANRCNSIDELHEALLNFDGCLLKKTATKTVFSDGNKNAKIMVIGEAPGANEDVQGIPFCGDSGKLFDIMLSHIGLSRKENLYITNAIFWRPPGNRKPTNDEITICLPWLEKHIALIKPELIILAGSTSVSAVLSLNDAMSKLRNDSHMYNNELLDKPIPVIIMYHPAYLLRQPSQKKLAWYDLLKVKHYIQKNNIKI